MKTSSYLWSRLPSTYTKCTLMMFSCSYCSSARATSRNPAAEVLLRSHVTLLRGKVALNTNLHIHVILQNTGNHPSWMFFPSPERCVDLQGFAQHLGSDVVHAVAAQVHFSQAGVAAQGVDQHGASRAQARVCQGQRLEGLGREKHARLLRKE